MMSAINCTPEEVSAYYTHRVPQLKQSGTEWRGPCPIHGGKNDNFAVKPETGEWYCHSACGKGGDILKLEQELTGADPLTCKDAVLQIIGTVESEHSCEGQPAGDLAGTVASEPAKTDFPLHLWTEVERYPYQDLDGNLLFEVIRYLKPDGDKEFRQCRPDGKGGVIPNLDGIKRVPYRLPKVIKAETVYLPEGEKDVHTLEKWGIVASCNPGGAGISKLYASWGEYFAGCHVVILPDNDAAGRKHASAVAAALMSAAASIRIVELPGLPLKGDVTDWREAGGTKEEFCKLVGEAQTLNPAALSALRKSWAALDGQKANPKGSANVLATRRLSDIEAKPVSWLWQGRIARGKVSMIAGNPGLGKSQLAAYIAAVVTTGGLWPVDQQQCQVGNVVFLNAEDDPADTLRPRFEAAGADLDRVHFVDGVTFKSGNGDFSKQFSLAEDLQALDNTLEKLGNVAAVVIDPITAYLGKIDSHKNAEVRALLAPLAELAAQHNTAIICISHLTKAAGPQALLRVMGSLAFVAAARAVYIVAADPQDKARRLFLPMKNNIGLDHEGLAFHIESAIIQSKQGSIPTSRVAWESEPIAMTADEAMQSETGTQSSPALAEAKEWLQATLADGPVWSAKLYEMAKAAGIAKATLLRAKKALSAFDQKQKGSMKGGWLWSLPGKVVKTGEVVQEKTLSTFGDHDHLPGSEGFADQL